MNSEKRKIDWWQVGPIICIVLFLAVIVVNRIKFEQELDRNKIHVLYIDNSLTYVNDLPHLIADLARANRKKIVFDVHAPGGRKFSQHASDPIVLRKIKQQPWDFVVLQEQSQMPAFSQAQVEKTVYRYAKQLSQQIKSANSKTKIVFYQTMARENGDPANIGVSPELGTYEGMQRRINRSYEKMAQDNYAILAPIGTVWAKTRSQSKSIHLYADEVHPNIQGTYLSACVFYATFFQETPVGLPHPRKIDDQTEKTLQEIVHREIILSSKK